MSKPRKKSTGHQSEKKLRSRPASRRRQIWSKLLRIGSESGFMGLERPRTSKKNRFLNLPGKLYDSKHEKFEVFTSKRLPTSTRHTYPIQGCGLRKAYLLVESGGFHGASEFPPKIMKNTHIYRYHFFLVEELSAGEPGLCAYRSYTRGSAPKSPEFHLS